MSSDWDPCRTSRPGDPAFCNIDIFLAPFIVQIYPLLLSAFRCVSGFCSLSQICLSCHNTTRRILHTSLGECGSSSYNSQAAWKVWSTSSKSIYLFYRHDPIYVFFFLISFPSGWTHDWRESRFSSQFPASHQWLPFYLIDSHPLLILVFLFHKELETFAHALVKSHSEAFHNIVVDLFRSYLYARGSICFTLRRYCIVLLLGRTILVAYLCIRWLPCHLPRPIKSVTHSGRGKF